LNCYTQKSQSQRNLSRGKKKKCFEEALFSRGSWEGNAVPARGEHCSYKKRFPKEREVLEKRGLCLLERKSIHPEKDKLDKTVWRGKKSRGRKGGSPKPGSDVHSETANKKSERQKGPERKGGRNHA